jgi:hypothetical protein
MLFVNSPALALSDAGKDKNFTPNRPPFTAVGRLRGKNIPLFKFNSLRIFFMAIVGLAAAGSSDDSDAMETALPNYWAASARHEVD